MHSDIKTSDIIAEQIDIKSPETLFKIAEDLREFVKSGYLTKLEGNCSLDDLHPNRPYPDDVIHIAFLANDTKIKYYLIFETYHRSGGEFYKEGEDRFTRRLRNRSNG